MAIPKLCFAAVCSSLFHSCQWAAREPKNACKCFEGQHSVFAANCNFTLAAKGLSISCTTILKGLLGGGHWGILETAKPKKKSSKTAKPLKNSPKTENRKESEMQW